MTRGVVVCGIAGLRGATGRHRPLTALALGGSGDRMRSGALRAAFTRYRRSRWPCFAGVGCYRPTRFAL